MKKIFIIVALLGILILSGCMGYTTNEAYFDMGCEDSYNSCKNLEQCDNICDNSSIRINRYKHENRIIFSEGTWICKCY